MNDLINRQAAIEAINQICPIDTDYDCTLLDRVDVRCVLTDLPSAQPERKKGFWYTLKKGDKGYSAGDFKCSVCGEPNHTWLPRPKFCSNCGAEMSIYEEPVKIKLSIN